MKTVSPAFGGAFLLDLYGKPVDEDFFHQLSYEIIDLLFS